MKFIFTCPQTHKDFETDAFRIVEDKGVQRTPSGQKVWDAIVELSAPCPLCGGIHTYNAANLPCPFVNPSD